MRPSRRSFSLAPVVGLVLLLATPSAGASDLRQFLADVDVAYDHYRQAMFYLRTDNPSVAGFDLEQMQGKWSAITARYAEAPPRPFAADPGFDETLTAVGAALADGVTLAGADDADAARSALAPIRDLLGDLRRRNQLYTLSDCVDEFSAAADTLWAYRHAPPDFADADAVNAMRRAAAIAEYLLGRCRAMAEPAHGTAAEFQALFDGAEASAASLWPAIDADDTQRVINILREFRSFDRMIYLRYG